MVYKRKMARLPKMVFLALLLDSRVVEFDDVVY
jgi:hypothetical protein